MDTIPPKSKPSGRPKGTGTAPGKLLRVLLTPRQERLLTQVRVENGISESEFCRRALDDLFDKMEARGELVDSGPASVVVGHEVNVSNGDHAVKVPSKVPDDTPPNKSTTKSTTGVKNTKKGLTI